MSEPWKQECDTCGHERWNHGEDGLKCGHGWKGDCDCQEFRDEAKEAAPHIGPHYWTVAGMSEGPGTQRGYSDWWIVVGDGSRKRLGPFTSRYDAEMALRVDDDDWKLARQSEIDFGHG